MIIFYIVILALSFAVLLLHGLVKWFSDGKKGFIPNIAVPYPAWFTTVSERQDEVLFALLPRSLTAAAVWACAFGGAGFGLELLYMRGFSVIFAAAFGCGVCLALQYALPRAVISLAGRKLPRGDKAAGITGYCKTALINDTAVTSADPANTSDPAGNYGKGVLTHFGKEYEVYIMSAVEGADIPAGYKITVMWETDGIYFVTTDETMFALL